MMEKWVQMKRSAFGEMIGPWFEALSALFKIVHVQSYRTQLKQRSIWSIGHGEKHGNVQALGQLREQSFLDYPLRTTPMRPIFTGDNVSALAPAPEPGQRRSHRAGALRPTVIGLLAISANRNWQ
jgi:hypothetical protein